MEKSTSFGYLWSAQVIVSSTDCNTRLLLSGMKFKCESGYYFLPCDTLLCWFSCSRDQQDIKSQEYTSQHVRFVVLFAHIHIHVTL